jgi:lysophospholipase L1-like esterase
MFSQKFGGIVPINRIKDFLRIAAMKNRSLTLILASACIGLGTLTTRAQVANIEPFGDSVTSRGSAPESSYRYWLWSDLNNAGYTNEFNFVGLTGGVTGGSPANPWPEEAYTGGEGLDSAGALAADMPGAAQLTPDIVLLDLGSNDIFDSNGFDSGTTETNLEAIIQDFATYNANVVILLARPTRFLVDPTLPKQSQQQEQSDQAKLDSLMNRVASAERKAGVDVIVVSLGGYNPRTDTVDGTHPNVRGEQYIARQFFNALRPVLKKMGVEPQKIRRH